MRDRYAAGDRMARMPRSVQGPGAHPPQVPVWLTVGWVVVWAVALVAPAAAGLGGTDHPALGAVGLAGVLGCFTAAVLGTALRPRSVRTWAPLMVTVQFGLTAALAGLDGLPWQTLPLLLAIGVAVVAPLRWAPSLVGVVAVAAVALDVGRGSAWSTAVWATGITTVLAGLLTWALLWLSAVVQELHRTRLELARSAVAAERLRFSRDLHDLLGHSLSVISVKAQAARRSLPADPHAAARHAADIETLSRDALAEVRQAVQGYRQTSLDAELQRAAGALRAAGIETEVVRGETSLTPVQEELLAWVVREGATNVLRHARARRARIVTGSDAGGASLVVEDDGDGPDADEDRAATDGRAASVSGSGLTGLRERLSHAGGTLSTRGDADGFRLSVHLPSRSGRIAP
jgi:two-component system, NarL family, sensor histidine kinase DesK